VFEAADRHGKAIEINSRPDRLDPPSNLLTRAARITDLLFAINTDAHAPEQLLWQVNGVQRAEKAGLTADRIINSWPVEQLLDWTASHGG
jgi:putative hydrolase